MLQLARLVHALFTRFDAAVRACGLFKMDTVGDAYIVAALLPEGGGGGCQCTASAAATRRACCGLLVVARVMLEELGEHRRTTKQVPGIHAISAN